MRLSVLTENKPSAAAGSPAPPAASSGQGYYAASVAVSDSYQAYSPDIMVCEKALATTRPDPRFRP